MTEVYDDIEQFRRANEERRHSGECDFGVWWTDEQEWPRWRVSYVRETGEVYAVQLAGAGRVEVFGVIPVDEPPENGVTYRWFATADEVLDGWDGELHKPNSLKWARDRVRAFEKGGTTNGGSDDGSP